ncbi:hypothetical protein Tco_1269751, partial [Tanacetum coccineum]
MPDCMVHDVTDDEIKSDMFSMGDDRASGPDVLLLLSLRKLGMWWVVILLVLLGIFSPMCISKIIANRVKEGLGDIVSINQSAFVPGRRISDNILLTQELMRNYPCRFWFSSKDGPMDYGDPLSPYLFTLVMEILTLLLQRKVSGLVPSIPKSTAYFCNVPNAIKASILNSMPFAEGVLPVRCGL